MNQFNHKLHKLFDHSKPYPLQEKAFSELLSVQPGTVRAWRLFYRTMPAAYYELLVIKLNLIH